MKNKPFLRSFRLVRELGARSGLHASYLLMRKELARRPTGHPRRLRIPDVAQPVWLREGTSDFDVMEQIFVRREYDFSEWPSHDAMIRKTYADLLRRGKTPVIVDCGANVGYASVWFARQYPQAIVHAVEPEPRNFAVLRRNASAYANVTPVQAGISDRVTKLALRNPTDEPWACQTDEDDAGPVETVTVPALLDIRPDCAPLIVKVDIEGYETSLFRSNTGWVARTPLVVFEMHDWLFHWRGTGDAVLRCLTQRRRDYLVRGENIFAFAHPEEIAVSRAAEDRTAVLGERAAAGPAQ
jgi:FkbM family methyltransferase